MLEDSPEVVWAISKTVKFPQMEPKTEYTGLAAVTFLADATVTV